MTIDNLPPDPLADPLADPSPVIPPLPAVPRRAWLIWLIPLGAAIVAIWLGVQSLAGRGPTIDITFETAEGIEAGHTKIRHKSVDLGTVEKIVLAPDLNHVVVTARMTSEAEPLLTTGTRFWIVRPRVGLGEISGLATILSGSYIEAWPDKGDVAREFQGLDEPPVLQAQVPGRYFVLTTHHLGSLAQGSPIYYHGIQVGEVLGDQLSDKTGAVSIYIFVRAPHADLVRSDTRFWSVSGISLSAGARGFRLSAASLQSLLVGGIAFDSGSLSDKQPISPEGEAFPLYANQDSANDDVVGPHFSYVAEFPGSVHGLASDATVELQGIPVGHVTGIKLVADPSGIVHTPVTFDLEPGRILGAGAVQNAIRDRAPFDAILGRMVAHGLRARLEMGSLLTGQKAVALDFDPKAPKAALNLAATPPVMPTVNGGGLDGIIASTRKFTDQLAALPLGDLVQDIRTTIRGVGDLTTSPEMKRSIKSLDGTLANLAEITQSAKADVGPTLHDLRAAAKSVDSIVEGTNGQAGVADLTQQLTEAARSLRLLSDYLEQHPEALIRGKSP